MEDENITYTFEKDISIPKMIFIIPYRDRKIHLDIFQKHMQTILEDYPKNDYKIYYVHQCDDRNFNRGAMKNIGFLYVKNTYPKDYKNITLIFNDVDIMPRNKNQLIYNTHLGNVKHFYGYNFTLGGIVSIKASDFEKINGFPNYWAWGFEDNALQNRVKRDKLNIDRSQFYKMLDSKNIIHLNETTTRTINRGEFDKYIHNVQDGIDTIENLKYEFDEDTNFINVKNFHVPFEENKALDKLYDLRNGTVPFKRNRRQCSMGLHYI